ncbi:hypothetical protein GALMADRAFT_161155 [Galerina marginata CBS 339.88]|uniref:Uncharacterized protein n=1 Tax=Galerina marginata (strain CBS 339.88) TaxID=685588 RepID=A0A067SND2_GALM3|nr:hypothetical protein GALMADRAFT_161155 [Galerina marginata CBS 339.88]
MGCLGVVNRPMISEWAKMWLRNVSFVSFPNTLSFSPQYLPDLDQVGETMRIYAPPNLPAPTFVHSLNTRTLPPYFTVRHDDAFNYEPFTLLTDDGPLITLSGSAHASEEALYMKALLEERGGGKDSWTGFSGTPARGGAWILDEVCPPSKTISCPPFVSVIHLASVGLTGSSIEVNVPVLSFLDFDVSTANLAYDSSRNVITPDFFPQHHPSRHHHPRWFRYRGPSTRALLCRLPRFGPVFAFDFTPRHLRLKYLGQRLYLRSICIGFCLPTTPARTSSLNVFPSALNLGVEEPSDDNVMAAYLQRGHIKRSTRMNSYNRSRRCCFQRGGVDESF